MAHSCESVADGPMSFLELRSLVLYLHQVRGIECRAEGGEERAGLASLPHGG